MIDSMIFSKKTMTTHGNLVISIPPEIIEDMELADREMVEVRLTKKMHVPTTSVVPLERIFISRCGKKYIPSDMEVAEVFR